VLLGIGFIFLVQSYVRLWNSLDFIVYDFSSFLFFIAQAGIKKQMPSVWLLFQSLQIIPPQLHHFFPLFQKLGAVVGAAHGLRHSVGQLVFNHFGLLV
jgi:hypothetical protein